MPGWAKWMCCLAAAVACLAPALPRPSEAATARPRIAVLEFKPEGIDASEAAAVSDRLRSSFVNLGAFTVLDREEIQSVLAELAFQQQGVTDANQAVEVGKLLNVQYIVTGRVRRLDDAYHVNTRMVDVRTGEIVRSEDIIYRGSIVGLLSENMDTIAARLSHARAGADKSIEVAEEPGHSKEWAFWGGAGAVAAGVLIQIGARNKSNDAVEMANDAIATGNTAEYEQAQTLQSEAEAQQRVAFLVGGAGAALLLYYYWHDEGDRAASSATHSLLPRFTIGGTLRSPVLQVSMRW